MTFNEILRTLREEAGLTQAGLAEKSGVPLRTIQGWEQGYRCPVSPDFFKLTGALGVSADRFAEVSTLPEGKKGTAGASRKSGARPRKGKGA
jgi:transcriptional regulator with XRE-family HTH domain